MAKAKIFKVGQTYLTCHDPKVNNGTRFITILDRENVNDLVLITFRVHTDTESETKKLYAKVYNYAGDEMLEYVPYEYTRATLDLLK